MNLSAIGFASAVAIGAKVGGHVADAGVDFAQVLAKKLAGSEEDSRVADQQAGQGAEVDDFKTALNSFDKYLATIGIDAQSARRILQQEDGSSKVEINSIEFAPWQMTSLKNWIDENTKYAQVLQLPKMMRSSDLSK